MLRQNESKLIIPGPSGDLDARIAIPKDNMTALGIICHPHPLYGGTMDNKVVVTILQALQRKGYGTLRFNFRGVGHSAGSYDEGRGETDDLLSVWQWVKEHYPTVAICFAGMSFGGYVAIRGAMQVNVARLITVAPAVTRFFFTMPPHITCPWLFIQGDMDDVIAPEKVFAFIDTLEPKPTLIRLAEAGHFFHGQLLALRAVIEDGL